MIHAVKVGDKVRCLVNCSIPELPYSKVCTVVEAYDGFFEGCAFCDIMLPCGRVITGLHQLRFEVVT